MPKIKKVRLEIHGKWNEYELWYDAKHSYFYFKNIPQEFLNISEWDNMASTETKLENDFIDAKNKYKEKVRNTKKVIMYDFKTSPRLSMNKVENGYSGFRTKQLQKALQNRGSTNGVLSIAIDYAVYNKIDTAGKIDYFKIDIETGLQGKYRDTDCTYYSEIEYTDERYQFFKGIEEAMKVLVDKLANFFGADSEQIIKMIDSNIKLISNETSQNQ